MALETPERIIDDVGRRIAELRKERNLTQHAMCERLGMQVADYQAIERGVRNVTLRTLVHVARALEVPTQALFQPPASREPRRRGRPSNR